MQTRTRKKNFRD